MSLLLLYGLNENKSQTCELLLELVSMNMNESEDENYVVNW